MEQMAVFSQQIRVLKKRGSHQKSCPLLLIFCFFHRFDE